MELVRPTPPPFDWAEDFLTFGVTGTNGKTSTAHLLARIIRAAGHPSLLLGTVGYYIDDEELGLPHTRGGFFDALRRAHERGVGHAAIEATSKALADGYAKRWRFDIGVFTNLSPDHLSTHGSYEHYLASKAQLFVHLGPGRTAVLNAADAHAQLLDHATPPDVSRLWYGSPTRGPLHRAADLQARSIEVSGRGTHVQLEGSELADALGGVLNLQMVGAVFAENALAAACAAYAAGFEPGAIVDGLAGCPPVLGRFEVLNPDPVVVVDYAHTPDALERTCDQAASLCTGKFTVVFGAGGGSTPQKREPMGRAVGERADRAIVTNDNPRDDDPGSIAEAVAQGVRAGGRAHVDIELDRARAIADAVTGAKPGDVVLIAGKGHERGQTIDGETLPFSDHEEARKWI